MSVHKISYGIDLGTTNSSIASVDNGNIYIIKNPSSHMDTTPSTVHYTRKGIQFIGMQAYSLMGRSPEDLSNTFTEFKRTMGYDKIYPSSRMRADFTSEYLSAEVLKELKLFVEDDEFNTAIITVPADFKQVQIDATQKAAEMAGLKYCELLQEPIAAALAYGIDKNDINGYWMVFDFGGGTFDAALVKMDRGLIKVVDNAGDNHLGGKNLDEDIVDEVLIPYIKENFTIVNILAQKDKKECLLQVLKQLAETAKIALTRYEATWITTDEVYFPIVDDDGKDINFEIEFKRNNYDSIIEKRINKAINICIDLLKRNNISPNNLITVLPVGGVTYIPYVRERIQQDICHNVDFSVDPMTVVAKGAAIFALTRSIPTNIQKRNSSKIQLMLGYPDTSIELEVKMGLKIEIENQSITLPDNIFVEIQRADKGWGSGKIELVDKATILTLNLLQNQSNCFNIKLSDGFGNRVECEPNSISILQGIKISNPSLPHDIGISAIKTGLDENAETFAVILKKNQTLPAIGQRMFKTPKIIRPGNPDDKIEIIIWEGKEYTRPIRNEWVGKVTISGAMLASLLPENSDLNITLKIDESRRITVSADIPYLDETIDEVMDTSHRYSEVSKDWINEMVESIKFNISELKDDSTKIEEINYEQLNDLEKELYNLEDSIEKNLGDYDKSAGIKNRLNELAINIDSIKDDLSWPRTLYEIDEGLAGTQDTTERYGSESEIEHFAQIKSKVEMAKERKDNILIKDLLAELEGLKYSIWFKQRDYWIYVLNNIDEYYNDINWEERLKAKSLLDEGKSIVNKRGPTENIENVVSQLWELMPETDRDRTRKTRDDLPWY